jgi:hypothetical protein
MKRIALIAVGFLTLAGLIGAIVRLPSGGGANNAPKLAAVPSSAPEGVARKFPGLLSTTTATTTTTGASTGGGGVTYSAGSGAADTAAQAGPVPVPAPASAPSTVHEIAAVGRPPALEQNELVGPRIIETAQLSLVTKRHQFSGAFNRASAIANTYGGFVASSSTQGVRSHFGRLTIRVPSSSFEPALHDLQRLGRVEGQSISGQDVTSQYVDLQARLRNWQAQERALLKLMSRATTIGETLRVQNELSSVQMRIEELKGQLRVLNDQTSLATIDVSMRESGVRPVPVAKHKESGGLVGAWRDSRHGFISVLAAVTVGLGYLVPIAILLALVWLGVRRMRPRVAA